MLTYRVTFYDETDCINRAIFDAESFEKLAQYLSENSNHYKVIKELKLVPHYFTDAMEEL